VPALVEGELRYRRPGSHKLGNPDQNELVGHLGCAEYNVDPPGISPYTTTRSHVLRGRGSFFRTAEIQPSV
jgi:hypothetical protein